MIAPTRLFVFPAHALFFANGNVLNKNEFYREEYNFHSLVNFENFYNTIVNMSLST